MSLYLNKNNDLFISYGNDDIIICTYDNNGS